MDNREVRKKKERRLFGDLKGRDHLGDLYLTN
jgi:hypothetical protein